MSETPRKEVKKLKNITLDDYDQAVVTKEDPKQMHKSIEENTNTNSRQDLVSKNSKKSPAGTSIASKKLLSSLKKHIKKANRYKSNLRKDDNLPYQFNEAKNRSGLGKISSKDSLRSVSERSSIVGNKFKLKFKPKKKDYPFEYIPSKIKQHKNSLRREDSSLKNLKT